jgi:hypothetical protein
MQENKLTLITPQWEQTKKYQLGEEVYAEYLNIIYEIQKSLNEPVSVSDALLKDFLETAKTKGFGKSYTPISIEATRKHNIHGIEHWGSVSISNGKLGQKDIQKGTVYCTYDYYDNEQGITKTYRGALEPVYHKVRALDSEALSFLLKYRIYGEPLED